jgi:hypothetical protein
MSRIVFLLGVSAGGCGSPGPLQNASLTAGAGQSGASQEPATSGQAGIGGSAVAGSTQPAVEPFGGAVSEQSFPNEYFAQVWGTDSELWILGRPGQAPDPNAMQPVETCSPARFDATSILRRKTDGDFALVDQPATTFLTSLHGSSASDVWLVGLGGAVFQFDGAAWHAHDIRKAEGLAFDEVPCWELSLQAVFARSPTDVWVVGGIFSSTLGPGLILHYDGRTWKRHAVGAPDGLFDVWAASDSDVWVVGASGLAYHYDGSTWQRVNAATENYLFSVLGTSQDDVWAVGNTSVATHFDGSGWRLIDPGADFSTSSALAGNSQGGVWALTTTGVTGAGDSWRQSLTHWDGNVWTAVSSTTDRKQMLNDLYMTPSGQLWGVGGSVIQFR